MNARSAPSTLLNIVYHAPPSLQPKSMLVMKRPQKLSFHKTNFSKVKGLVAHGINIFKNVNEQYYNTGKFVFFKLFQGNNYN